MAINEIEPLSWDSNFFGYPIARVLLDHNGSDLLDSLFGQLSLKKMRLTYFFVPDHENGIKDQITFRGGVLVDRKTVFKKKTKKQTVFSNLITELSGTKVDENLNSLVLQAGEFSRFKTDNNFTTNEYERLYTTWLLKSVNKELAKKVLVAVINSGIRGITTVNEKEGNAEIGLIAVDKDFRGRGIGYDLIKAADNYAFEQGYSDIRVVTQLQNKGACKLYEKCGFVIESITDVYHFWQ